MSEYIVNVPDEQAEQFMARFGIEGTQVFGFQLTGEIVRCCDCNWFTNSSHYGAYCTNFGAPLHDDYDGYCAWADRRADA